MKALAIRQPWAWLIVQGIKDIENRTWQTHYRGPFLVHASKAIDDEVREVKQWLSKRRISLPEYLPRGGIVGVVTLVDCVEGVEVSWWRRLACLVFGKSRVLKCGPQLSSAWFEGPYGFVLQDARPLPFMPWRGQQGFFNVADDLYGNELDLSSVHSPDIS